MAGLRLRPRRRLLPHHDHDHDRHDDHGHPVARRLLAEAAADRDSREGLLPVHGGVQSSGGNYRGTAAEARRKRTTARIRDGEGDRGGEDEGGGTGRGEGLRDGGESPAIIIYCN